MMGYSAVYMLLTLVKIQQLIVAFPYVYRPLKPFKYPITSYLESSRKLYEFMSPG